MVSYDCGREIPWGDVVFHVVLEDLSEYEALDLPEDVQRQIDQVVSSFELTGD